MLPLEHSVILLTFTELPVVIKTFVLSFFQWPFYTGFTEVQNIYGEYCPLLEPPCRPDQTPHLEIRKQDVTYS